MYECSILLSNLADWKIVFTLAGAAALSGVGLTPKVGFVRAFFLAGKSRFSGKLRIESVRKMEINKLRKKINSLNDGRYLVVTGGKGYGKTCLIESALDKQPSVLKISVSFYSFC